jgi:hypothetical protein
LEEKFFKFKQKQTPPQNYVIRAKKKPGTQAKAGCKERKAPPSKSG